jgi:hypothetical protein
MEVGDPVAQDPEEQRRPLGFGFEDQPRKNIQIADVLVVRVGTISSLMGSCMRMSWLRAGRRIWRV